jgi:hypothetical protein
VEKQQPDGEEEGSEDREEEEAGDKSQEEGEGDVEGDQVRFCFLLCAKSCCLFFIQGCGSGSVGSVCFGPPGFGSGFIS